MDATLRRFVAHCANEDAHAAPFVAQAPTFAEAAFLFAERWHGPEPEIRVIVVDAETGAQECFTLHLDDGSAEPC